MDPERLDDALSSMTKKQLELLQEKINRQLLECIVCHSEGAKPYRVYGRESGFASMLFCKPCFERFRLPEGRAKESG